MISTIHLRAKMIENRLTIALLAKQMRLSTTGLFNKIHGKQDFTVTEMNLLKEILFLTRDEIDKIFFNQNVDVKSTKN